MPPPLPLDPLRLVVRDRAAVDGHLRRGDDGTAAAARRRVARDDDALQRDPGVGEEAGDACAAAGAAAGDRESPDFYRDVSADIDDPELGLRISRPAHGQEIGARTDDSHTLLDLELTTERDHLRPGSGQCRVERDRSPSHTRRQNRSPRGACIRCPYPHRRTRRHP